MVSRLVSLHASGMSTVTCNVKGLHYHSLGIHTIMVTGHPSMKVNDPGMRMGLTNFAGNRSKVVERWLLYLQEFLPTVNSCKSRKILMPDDPLIVHPPSH